MTTLQNTAVCTRCNALEQAKCFVEHNSTVTHINATGGGGRGPTQPRPGTTLSPDTLENNLIYVYIVTRQDVNMNVDKASHAAYNAAEETHMDATDVVAAARVHAAALADSGAIHGSYISTSMGERLRKKGVSMAIKTQRVCSFNSVCTTVLQ